MDTHNDTACESPAAAVPRRSGTDWGHLPHGHLTNLIIGAAFEVHNTLGAGFLEAVYANALTVELRHRGVSVERNIAFDVVYRAVSVGRYVADFVVDRKVIVETKVAKAIDPVHRAQVSNYLRASDLEVGLVINFGTSVQFKRVVASPHRTNERNKAQQGQENVERPDTDEERSRR
jgi:GxxExxY protein